MGVIHNGQITIGDAITKQSAVGKRGSGAGARPTGERKWKPWCMRQHFLVSR